MPRPLPVRPKIPDYFDIIAMPNGQYQIRAGDDRIFVLRGQTASQTLPHLLGYLDGSHTVPDLADRCKGVASEDEIAAILERLNEVGILEDASVQPPPALTSDDLACYAPQLRFFSHFPGDKYTLQAKLKNSSVAVVGSGLIHATVLASLSASGVGHITSLGMATEPSTGHRPDAISGNGAQAGLMLPSALTSANPGVHLTRVDLTTGGPNELAQAVHGHDVLAVALDVPSVTIYETLNEVCLAQNIPWIQSSSLSSIEGTVGPFIVPGETACYTCYQLRIRSNVDARAEYEAFQDYLRAREGETASYGYLPQFAAVIGQLLALEIVKHLTQFVLPVTYGSQLSLTFTTLESQLHEVLKLPRCPTCGPAHDEPPKAFWSE
jgi:bacteriocin biosynthesis cyclodehydratase domain-containing protein